MVRGSDSDEDLRAACALAWTRPADRRDVTADLTEGQQGRQAQHVQGAGLDAQPTRRDGGRDGLPALDQGEQVVAADGQPDLRAAEPRSP